MTPRLIADAIFWTALAGVALAIYQAAILPSIRLHIRCEIFQLRDRLRALVIEGRVSESDKAFHLLHERLNFLSCNLFRYDLLRIAQSLHHMTESQRAHVAACVRTMEEADEEIQKIYRQSLDEIARAVVFNSLFLFVVVSIGFGLVLLCQVGLHRVKEAYKRRIEQDARAALVLPEVAAVAV